MSIARNLSQLEKLDTRAFGPGDKINMTGALALAMNLPSLSELIVCTDHLTQRETISETGPHSTSQPGFGQPSSLMSVPTFPN